MKMNAVKKKNIQRIAQRFIDACYSEFKRMRNHNPAFSFVYGKGNVSVNYLNGKWSCFYASNIGSFIKIEI